MGQTNSRGKGRAGRGIGVGPEEPAQSSLPRKLAGSGDAEIAGDAVHTGNSGEGTTGPADYLACSFTAHP